MPGLFAVNLPMKSGVAMGIPSAASAPLRKNDGAKKSASDVFPNLASASRLVVTSFVSFAK